MGPSEGSPHRWRRAARPPALRSTGRAAVRKERPDTGNGSARPARCSRRSASRQRGERRPEESARHLMRQQPGPVFRRRL